MGCAAGDSEAIVAWQQATPGRSRDALLSRFFIAKAGLVRSLARKAASEERSSVAEQELLQAGYIGLRRAVAGFDASRGLSIATYAWWWIKHEVQRVSRGEKLIALPRIRLAQAEIVRAIEAARANPDVDPESIGIPRSKFEQVRNSYGLRFTSEATPAGSMALERALAASGDELDPEERVDRGRAMRSLDLQVDLVRAGATAGEAGVSEEIFRAIQKYLDETTKERAMSEEAVTTTPATDTKKRAWSPERKAAHAAKRAAAAKPSRAPGRRKQGAGRRRTAPSAPAAPNRFAARLLELEAEQKERDAEKAALEYLTSQPPSVAAALERVLRKAA